MSDAKSNPESTPASSPEELELKLKQAEAKLKMLNSSQPRIVINPILSRRLWDRPQRAFDKTKLTQRNGAHMHGFLSKLQRIEEEYGRDLTALCATFLKPEAEKFNEGPTFSAAWSSLVKQTSERASQFSKVATSLSSIVKANPSNAFEEADKMLQEPTRKLQSDIQKATKTLEEARAKFKKADAAIQKFKSTEWNKTMKKTTGTAPAPDWTLQLSDSKKKKWQELQDEMRAASISERMVTTVYNQTISASLDTYQKEETSRVEMLTNVTFQVGQSYSQTGAALYKESLATIKTIKQINQEQDLSDYVKTAESGEPCPWMEPEKKEVPAPAAAGAGAGAGATPVEAKKEATDGKVNVTRAYSVAPNTFNPFSRANQLAWRGAEPTHVRQQSTVPGGGANSTNMRRMSALSVAKATAAAVQAAAATQGASSAINPSLIPALASGSSSSSSSSASSSAASSSTAASASTDGVASASATAAGSTNAASTSSAAPGPSSGAVSPKHNRKAPLMPLPTRPLPSIPAASASASSASSASAPSTSSVSHTPASHAPAVSAVTPVASPAPSSNNLAPATASAAANTTSPRGPVISGPMSVAQMQQMMSADNAPTRGRALSEEELPDLSEVLAGVAGAPPVSTATKAPPPKVDTGAMSPHQRSHTPPAGPAGAGAHAAAQANNAANPLASPPANKDKKKMKVAPPPPPMPEHIKKNMTLKAGQFPGVNAPGAEAAAAALEKPSSLQAPTSPPARRHSHSIESTSPRRDTLSQPTSFSDLDKEKLDKEKAAEARRKAIIERDREIEREEKLKRVKELEEMEAKQRKDLEELRAMRESEIQVTVTQEEVNDELDNADLVANDLKMKENAEKARIEQEIEDRARRLNFIRQQEETALAEIAKIEQEKASRLAEIQNGQGDLSSVKTSEELGVELRLRIENEQRQRRDERERLEQEIYLLERDQRLAELKTEEEIGRELLAKIERDRARRQNQSKRDAEERIRRLLLEEAQDLENESKLSGEEIVRRAEWRKERIHQEQERLDYERNESLRELESRGAQVMQRIERERELRKLTLEQLERETQDKIAQSKLGSGTLSGEEILKKAEWKRRRDKEDAEALAKEREHLLEQQLDRGKEVFARIERERKDKELMRIEEERLLQTQIETAHGKDRGADLIKKTEWRKERERQIREEMDKARESQDLDMQAHGASIAKKVEDEQKKRRNEYTERWRDEEKRFKDEVVRKQAEQQSMMEELAKAHKQEGEMKKEALLDIVKKSALVLPGQTARVVEADGSYKLENRRPVIIDNGAGYFKAGFSGDTDPTFVVPSVVATFPSVKSKTEPGLWDNERDFLVGESAVHFSLGVCGNPKDVIVNQSVFSDNPVNWDDLEKMWAYLFVNLQHDLSMHPVFITQPALAPRQLKEKMTEILFEKFNVPAVYVATAPMLAAYAQGASTGLVVDIGASSGQIVPIIDGYIIDAHVKRAWHLGGHRDTKRIVDVLNSGIVEGVLDRQKYPSPYHVHTVAQSIKERLSLCAETKADYTDSADVLDTVEGFLGGGDPDRPQDDSGREDQKKAAQLNALSLQKEFMKCGEVLFQPEQFITDVDGSMQSVPQLVLDVVNRCEMDARKELLSHIFLSGGVTTMPGFKNRLFRELKDLMPHAPYINIHGDGRRYAVWTGGSVLTSIPEFQRSWEYKFDYEERGVDVAESDEADAQ